MASKRWSLPFVKAGGQGEEDSIEEFRINSYSIVGKAQGHCSGQAPRSTYALNENKLDE